MAVEHIKVWNRSLPQRRTHSTADVRNLQLLVTAEAQTVTFYTQIVQPFSEKRMHIRFSVKLRVAALPGRKMVVTNVFQPAKQSGDSDHWSR